MQTVNPTPANPPLPRPLLPAPPLSSLCNKQQAHLANRVNISDWFRPRYEQNACLLLTTQGLSFLSAGRGLVTYDFFFSRTFEEVGHMSRALHTHVYFLKDRNRNLFSSVCRQRGLTGISPETSA